MTAAAPSETQSPTRRALALHDELLLEYDAFMDALGMEGPFPRFGRLMAWFVASLPPIRYTPWGRRMSVPREIYIFRDNALKHYLGMTQGLLSKIESLSPNELDTLIECSRINLEHHERVRTFRDYALLAGAGTAALTMSLLGPLTIAVALSIVIVVVAQWLRIPAINRARAFLDILRIVHATKRPLTQA